MQALEQFEETAKIVAFGFGAGVSLILAYWAGLAGIGLVDPPFPFLVKKNHDPKKH